MIAFVKKWLGFQNNIVVDERNYTVRHGSVGLDFAGSRFDFAFDARIPTETVINTFMTSVETHLIDNKTEYQLLVRGAGACPQSDNMLLSDNLSRYWARFEVLVDESAGTGQYLLYRTDHAGNFSSAMNLAILDALDQIKLLPATV